MNVMNLGCAAMECGFLPTLGGAAARLTRVLDSYVALRTLASENTPTEHLTPMFGKARLAPSASRAKALTQHTRARF